MKTLSLFLFLAASALAQQVNPPFPAAGGSCAGLAGDVTGTCGANTVVQIEGGAIPANAGALGTNASGQLISVAPGGGTTPGYPANQPVSGCGVEYVSGLIFSVGACTYTIGGVQYSSPITTVTLAAADVTNPRIDVIYVDNTGTASKLTGTPAASPAQPTVDYSTQLPLNLVLVAANGTTPSGIVTTVQYDENIEWTSSCGTHFNCASTNNPFRGTKDIEATAAVLGDSFTLIKPAAGTTDLSTQNTQIFYIRSKATWPTANNTGGNGLRTLSVFFLNGSTQVGLQVVIKDGAFGFSSSSTSAYQQIAIPTSLFGAGSNVVTTLKGQITGNGGTSSIGFYLDAFSLQSGQAPLTLPATLVNFKGTWNATANYNVNDEVVLNGLAYGALVANTNVAVTTTATWALKGGAPTASPTFTGTVNSSGATHTLPTIVVANTGALPATCTAGELAVVTGATLGQQLYQCSAGNVWTQQLNSGTATGGGITMYSATGLTVTANTYYIPLGGGGSISTTETNVDIDSPAAATVTNMFVQLSVALGGGNSGVFTMRKAGVSQSVTCTISGGSATSCSDTTHSFSVSQGDLLAIQLVTTGTIVVTPNILIAAQFGNITATGTVNSGTTGQVAYYAGNGSAVSGGNLATTCTAPQFLSAMAATGGTCTTPVLTQNSQSAAYTTVLGDAGKMLLHPAADNNARTFTIDSNANVAYLVGTCITFVNMINTVTIAITSDTMTLMGANTTGSRTLAVGNWATACKIASTSWVIGGSSGLT